MSLDRVLRTSKLIYFLKDVKQIITKKGNHWSLRWAWNEFGDMLGRGWIISKITSNSLLVPKQNIGKKPKLSPNSNIFSKQLFEQATKRKNTHKQWLEFGPSLEWVCSEFGTQNSFFPRKTGKEKKPENKTSLHRVWSEFAQSHFFKKG